MEYRSLVQNSAEELANILCTKRRRVGKYSRVLNLLKEMPILDKKLLDGIVIAYIDFSGACIVLLKTGSGRKLSMLYSTMDIT